jgi:hypothetical protein
MAVVELAVDEALSTAEHEDALDDLTRLSYPHVRISGRGGEQSTQTRG